MKGKAYNIISFLVGLGTLSYMVYTIGYVAIWGNIVQTGKWFVPVIGSWFFIYILNALAFREIIFERDTPQTAIPFWEILKITIAGYAINNITPFLALGGEPYRILQLQKRVSNAKAASSVLLYYIIHVFSHIVFWMASIVLIVAFLRPTNFVLFGCLATFLAFYLLVYWIVRQYKKGLLMTTFKSLQRVPFLRSRIVKFVEKKKESLLEIDQHVIELFEERKATFYAALFFEFIGRVVGCFEIYFIGLALNLNLSLVDSFIISAGSSLFANLVFFSPMQMGTREGGFVLALGSIGLTAGVGIFISLVTRIRELFWIFIGLLIIPVKTVRRS